VEKWFEELRAFADSMEICKYVTRTGLIYPEPLIKMLNAVTGLGFSVDDAYKIGERIINIKKAFNTREGFTRKDDTLLKRFLENPLPDGPSKGHICDLEPKKAAEEKGIKVLTEEKVVKVLGEESVERIITDKRKIKCNTVVLAIGIRPKVDLAR
jgi:aldehyde:ferredoxin oxidoreductase